MTGEALKNGLLLLGGNVLIGLSAIMAITHIIRREFVRFAEYMVLLLLVGSIVWAPDTWKTLATQASQWLK